MSVLFHADPSLAGTQSLPQPSLIMFYNALFVPSLVSDAAESITKLTSERHDPTASMLDWAVCVVVVR
jgi:hypothetical protein